MQTLADFPYFEVQFKKKGKVNDQREVERLLDFLGEGSTSDLLVISHGWNNDLIEARNLYKELLERVRAEIDADRPPSIRARRFAVLGILWPSKRFAEEDEIPSGAASLAAPEPNSSELIAQIEELKGFFDSPDADSLLNEAQRLVPHLQNDPASALRFADVVRSLPAHDEMNGEDNSDRFFTISSRQLMDTMSRPDVAAPPEPGMGGAAGFDSGDGTGAESLGIKDFFGGIPAAARKVLNFTTYFQMKQRAGFVGKIGACETLKQIRLRAPNIKIHLVGHSFGGRLVTSAANALDGSPQTRPNTMILLQAAFSHNGFAQRFDGKRDGFFREVITKRKISGPIIITHSVKDRAVGLAYPIASKLSGDDSAGLGASDDRFGGIGRNGAQHTPEADNTSALGPSNCAYSFQAGRLYNLNADSVIQGHSDIRRPEVAHALLCAVAIS
jgi:pimeloyl-ACP methyl ester carboxylesterase